MRSKVRLALTTVKLEGLCQNLWFCGNLYCPVIPIGGFASWTNSLFTGFVAKSVNIGLKTLCVTVTTTQIDLQNGWAFPDKGIGADTTRPWPVDLLDHSSCPQLGGQAPNSTPGQRSGRLNKTQARGQGRCVLPQHLVTSPSEHPDRWRIDS